MKIWEVWKKWRSTKHITRDGKRLEFKNEWDNILNGTFQTNTERNGTDNNMLHYHSIKIKLPSVIKAKDFLYCKFFLTKV